jgi:ornithine decarboxylase
MLMKTGSGAGDATAMKEAVQDSKRVFGEAGEPGFRPNILNAGGGFQNSNFESMAKNLEISIEEYFPDNLEVIAEQGRYFARSAYTLACGVIRRRSGVKG